MYALPEPEAKHLTERLLAAHAVGRASRDAEIEALRQELNQANIERLKWKEWTGKAEKEVEALRADRDQLQRDFTYIKQRRDALLTALEKLARLGNGDRYGNSEGNAIAIAALNGEK